ncbi:hypothetical protein BDA96_04G085600 [Sorghum bicolor]|uniref:Uncharacterized protein n=1 Tax=Sorghum bicolor TaxID=4558 RepID=A0A921R4X6_SORBI|nr:hypothetical protein BDA96_04G085600 [Sorghum bicolor]
MHPTDKENGETGSVRCHACPASKANQSRQMDGHAMPCHVLQTAAACRDQKDGDRRRTTLPCRKWPLGSAQVILVIHDSIHHSMHRTERPAQVGCSLTHPLSRGFRCEPPASGHRYTSSV